MIDYLEEALLELEEVAGLRTAKGLPGKRKKRNAPAKSKLRPPAKVKSNSRAKKKRNVKSKK
ncbi:MAG: hypothetical protein HRT77_17815 [Halioglobus sp.]|nr:hypothetical protein [Halioglobus sp.]